MNLTSSPKVVSSPTYSEPKFQKKWESMLKYVIVLRRYISEAMLERVPQVPGTRKKSISYRWHLQNFDILHLVAPALM